MLWVPSSVVLLLPTCNALMLQVLCMCSWVEMGFFLLSFHILYLPFYVRDGKEYMEWQECECRLNFFYMGEETKFLICQTTNNKVTLKRLSHFSKT